LTDFDKGGALPSGVATEVNQTGWPESVPTCAAPGCTNPPRERRDPRARRPRYCVDHNNSTAWSRAFRERQRAEREKETT
jgi:hypothetical protein